MPPTDGQRRWAVQLTAYALIALVVYAILIVGDWVAAKILDTSLAKSEPARIERQRFEKQDKRLIAEAHRLGLHSLLYPELFDEPKWRPLAERHGIAPLAPQPSTRLYYCNEGYGQVRYTSDRFGFRNADSVWDLKRVDLALIGDSYAQGACVPQDKSIAGVLGAKSTTVLNLATGGNGPVQYAALVKTFLPYVSAKYVAIVFYPNDNIDEEDSIYRKYFIDGKADYFSFGPHGRPIGPSARLQRLYEEADREAAREVGAHGGAGTDSPRAGFVSRLGYYLSLNTIRKLAGVFLPQRALPWSSKVAIDMLLAHCRKAGCRPVFVYIPSSAFWRPDPYAAAYDRLLQAYVAAQGGAKFVDMSDELGRRGRAAYAVAGPHLSPLGYALVAQAVERAIR